MPADVELEDAELLAWLLEHHSHLHRDLARRVNTKVYARSVSAGGVERTREYLAGDATAQAEDEYRSLMRHPAAWAHFKGVVADIIATDLPEIAHASCHEDKERCRQDPVGEARHRLLYARMRAEMRGAYGMPGTGDRPAAERWTKLTETVQENPALPGAAAPRL
jgi:hypothetical protein